MKGLELKKRAISQALIAYKQRKWTLTGIAVAKTPDLDPWPLLILVASGVLTMTRHRYFLRLNRNIQHSKGVLNAQIAMASLR
ncbi:hypothetical protein O9992_26040 [Vibrio lentus]|nr:hypothetical protein [Vibrio lentus]